MTARVESFDIAVFHGDPNRGPKHDGWMYSIRFRGKYVKSDIAFSSRAEAAFMAAKRVDVFLVPEEKGEQDNGI
jgi:hypothetical protein